MKGDFNIYGISEDWRKWEPGQTIREIRKNGKVGWQDRTKISRPVGNPETKNTLDTVPSTWMLKPVTKYCSDCRHMREGMTKCGPALFCQHPLESKHGFSKFRSEFCTVDQELYVPKLSRFARLVANKYRFVKK